MLSRPATLLFSAVVTARITAETMTATAVIITSSRHGPFSRLSGCAPFSVIDRPSRAAAPLDRCKRRRRRSRGSSGRAGTPPRNRAGPSEHQSARRSAPSGTQLTRPGGCASQVTISPSQSGTSSHGPLGALRRSSSSSTAHAEAGSHAAVLSASQPSARTGGRGDRPPGRRLDRLAVVDGSRQCRVSVLVVTGPLRPQLAGDSGSAGRVVLDQVHAGADASGRQVVRREHWASLPAGHWTPSLSSHPTTAIRSFVADRDLTPKSYNFVHSYALMPQMGCLQA